MDKTNKSTLVVDHGMVKRALAAFVAERGTFAGEVDVDADDIRAALTAALTSTAPPLVVKDDAWAMRMRQELIDAGYAHMIDFGMESDDET